MSFKLHILFFLILTIIGSHILYSHCIPIENILIATANPTVRTFENFNKSSKS